jgi:hypothetical protein
MKLYMNTLFIVISWIITSSGASTVRHNQGQKSVIDEREEENMNADHVYSHHDGGGDQDDASENDEGLNVECCT